MAERCHVVSPPAAVLAYKTRLCDNPEPCPYGDKCRFAHSKEEREARLIAMNPKWKTVMCDNPDPCFRGDRCPFAHDKKELRKTTVICRYGTRCKTEDCSFYHSPRE